MQEPQTFEGLEVNFSAIIRSEASVITTTNYTYAQFAHHVLRRVEIMASSSHVQRLDIVMDTYQSIKNATREARGTGPVHVFEENDKLPKNFKSFFMNDQNKTKLNEIIQKHAMNPLF